MQEGREVIYQGVLAHGDFAGRSDFLVRVKGASKLGDYHYEVWDTKLARKPKPYFLNIELCSYAEMLEDIQQRLPERIAVILGNQEELYFKTEDFIHHYYRLKEAFVEFHRAFPAIVRQKIFRSEHLVAGATFQTRCWKSVMIYRAANIRKSQMARLKNCGINTLTALANTQIVDVKDMAQETLASLKEQAQLQLETLASNRTAFKTIPTNQGKGLSLLPPQSTSDVFFGYGGLSAFRRRAGISFRSCVSR